MRLGINAASHGCIRVHGGVHQDAYLGQDDAFHRRHDGHEGKHNSAALPVEGSGRWRNVSGGKRHNLTVVPGACLVNVNAAVKVKALHLPRTWSRTPIVLIRPPSAPSGRSLGSARCRERCFPYHRRLRRPCLLLLLLRLPCPRRACRASCLRSYPQTPGRSSFGN